MIENYFRRFIAFLVFALLISTNFNTLAQIQNYTTSNAHSHNDYVNLHPFTTAYNCQFGSIEADIFLVNDSLFVGHSIEDTKQKKTIEKLYLEPLNNWVTENKGFPYQDNTLNLQLLIDIKTESKSTLNKLIQILDKYKQITNSNKIQIIITGNRPDINTFNSYPNFIFFDGLLNTHYPPEIMNKIALFSEDFPRYSSWDGQGDIPVKDKNLLDSLVIKAHQMNKKIRFWGAPDNPNSWKQFIKLKVDFINTDHIEQLSNFLKNGNH